MAANPPAPASASASVTPPAGAPPPAPVPSTSTRAASASARPRGLPALLDAAALLVLALCSVLLQRDALLGGPAHYERDTQVFYYPLADWVGGRLRSGDFPLWLPDIFTGYPIFADGEMGLLYLPQVLALWALPAPLAMAWLRALHTFLAGAFLYLFLRATPRLDPLPALGGGLVFAFGSFFTAQMHHENVVRSAIWLPLVLLLADRAQRAGWSRRGWAWLALAALAFAQAALGVHVQPVLMLAMALGGYALFRHVVGWPGVRLTATPPLPRLARTAFVPLGTVGGGVALAVAQWLPLFEWSRASFRRGGVSYEFASAFGIAPENLLPGLLFPYFFRHPDGATWWTLWQQWEIALYVGVPTLALALVGLLFSWRREVIFFAALGAFSVLVAMSHYAPVLALHQTLWSLPGFSFLRAPGRFSYLVVFAAAGLAALGLQALADRRAPLYRVGLLAAGAVPSAALLGLLLGGLPAAYAWLQADPARAQAAVDAAYLSIRAQYPIEPRVVVEGLLASLDLRSPKTAWGVALLGLTTAAFLAWSRLGPRRAPTAQALFVTLLAADLLVFAADFHPRARLVDLALPPLPGVPAGSRVFAADPPPLLPEMEPNHPLTAGLHQVDGYSSLPSQRHVELIGQTRAQPGLRRVWAAEYVVEARQPAGQRVASSGVRFHPERPLAAGFAATGSSVFQAPAGLGPLRAVRLVGTLSYAFDLGQGVPVAEVALADAAGRQVRLPVLAGVHLAERAINRPSIRVQMQHERPPLPPALEIEEWSRSGEAYQALLYQAELPLPEAFEPATVTVTPLHRTAFVQVHGLALVPAAAGQPPRSLGLADQEGLSVEAESGPYRVLRDARAAPRALVRGREAAVYRVARPSTTLAQVLSGPDFDPEANFLLELVGPDERVVPDLSGALELVGEALYTEQGQVWRVRTWRHRVRGTTLDTFESLGPADLQPAPARAAVVEDLGSGAVRITAEADRPSYLVLNDFYHRGWQAWVDGQPVPVYIANAVFRAVPLEAGHHVVEMRFQPLTHLLGAIGSLLALLAALAVVGWGFLTRPRPRARG